MVTTPRARRSRLVAFPGRFPTAVGKTRCLRADARGTGPRRIPASVRCYGADERGVSGDLPGRSAGGRAEVPPGYDPMDLAGRLDCGGSVDGTRLHRSREIGGLVSGVANGALTLVRVFPVPDTRRDADQQDQGNDHRRPQAGTHPEGGAASAVHDWAGILLLANGGWRPWTAFAGTARGARSLPAHVGSAGLAFRFEPTSGAKRALLAPARPIRSLLTR